MRVVPGRAAGPVARPTGLFGRGPDRPNALGHRRRAAPCGAVPSPERVGCPVNHRAEPAVAADPRPVGSYSVSAHSGRRLNWAFGHKLPEKAPGLGELSAENP